MTDPVCPKTGASMRRGVRPMTLEYKGANLTFDMPGWYCEKSDESIHTGEDMNLKAAVGAEFSFRLRAPSIPGCVSLVSDAEERARDGL
jgi:YgiT-type zinc finger domain-containing protein